MNLQNNNLRVNVEEIESMSFKYKSLVNKANDILNSLDKIIAEVGQNWTGKSSDAFRYKYGEWKNTSVNYVNNLAKISNELKDRAEDFRNSGGIG